MPKYELVLYKVFHVEADSELDAAQDVMDQVDWKDWLVTEVKEKK